MEPNGMRSIAGDTVSKEDEVRNLQKQLDTALREKETAMSLYKSTADELESLQTRLDSAQSYPQVERLERQALEIKDQYVNTMADMSSQTGQLQDELRRTKAELRSANQQVVELRATLEDVKSEINRGKQQRDFSTSTQASADAKIKSLTLQITDLRSQLAASQSEVAKCKKDKGLVEQQITEIQRKSLRDESKGMENMARMKDSIQLLESSIIDRDQALIREKQLKEEVVQLKSAISKLIDEAGARTRQEVDNVKKMCNTKLTKLMEEMHRLELDCSEKQAELERAMRERKGLEEELERVYKDGLMEGTREKDDYSDLVSRACAAERARDDAVAKVEALTNQLRRDEVTNKQEKQKQELELELIKDRLLKSEIELKALNDEREAVAKVEVEVRDELTRVKQDKENTTRENNKQLKNLKQTLQLKEREYETKLQSLEDSHRQYTLQMRDMLASQQKLSAKWKDECNVITKKLESRLSDSREELSREKKRVEELTKLLHDSRNKTLEAEARMSQCTRNMLALEARLSEAERKSAIHSEQAFRSRKTTKGLGLSDTRRQQQQQLENSFRESLKSLGTTQESPGI